MNFLQLKMKEDRYILMTAVLFWSGLAVMSSLYVTIPLVSVFSKIFSVSQHQSVWVSSIYSFCFAVGALIYGPLSDRLGRKKVIFWGLIVLMIASLFTGFLNNLSAIIVIRGVQGAAAATFSAVAVSYAMELFPPDIRVRSIAFISTGFLTAGIVGQVFSGFVTSHFSWNYVFFILAFIYLVTAALIVFLIPDRPPNGISMVNAFKQIKTVLGRGPLRFTYVIAFVLLLSFVGMYTALGSLLSSPKFGFDNQQILYVRIVGIIGMVLSPLAGKLVKKFGLLNVIRGALGVSVAGLVLLGIGSNIIALVAASVLFVLGIATAVPSLISLVGELGGAAKGAALSVYMFILFVGVTIGPILTVRLLETGSCMIAFFVLALCLSIGIFATFFINLSKSIH